MTLFTIVVCAALVCAGLMSLATIMWIWTSPKKRERDEHERGFIA